MSAKRTILIIDDDPKLRKTLSGILRAKGYVPTAAATGKAALDRAEEEMPAVALIDLKLEDMSGLKVMGEIKECSPGTECIVITGYASQGSAIEAVNLGAYSYVQKPYDMEQLLVTVRRAIEKREAEESLRAQRDKFEGIIASLADGLDIVSRDYRVHFQNKMLRDRFGDLTGKLCYEEYMAQEAPCESCPMVEAIATGSTQRVELTGADGREYEVTSTPFQDIDGEMKAIEVVRDITERKRAEEALQRSFEKLQTALEGTVHTLVSAIEMRDPYTGHHQRRVTRLACAIARDMGLPEEQIEGLRMAGLIHDLGKITIPAVILSKPTQLNDLEWGLIKTHPKVGYDVLKTVDFPWPVAQIVLQHHERLDGSGYSAGLSGEEVMLEARILAVADVVEAMASHRPYRPPRGLDKALEEIRQNRGVLYDAEVVDVCLKLFTEKGFAFE